MEEKKEEEKQNNGMLMLKLENLRTINKTSNTILIKLSFLYCTGRRKKERL